MRRLQVLTLALTLTLALLASRGRTAGGDSPVFAPGEQPQLVLEQGAGEGPAWDPQLGLLFSGEGNIMRLDRGRPPLGLSPQRRDQWPAV